ncbi:hypothetical protein M3Y97_00038100 [Aphelenchoides bicaudatus]|nr:hypothetical protein M3Y97_00038100 [Aphelenchoides bicaudatus]
MWTICFFCWYQFFCATFLGLISCSWYIIILLITPFLVIWFLSVSSLYRCLYTRPPLIPHTYLVPQRILNLLNKQDNRGFHGSDTNLNYVSMGDCESSTEQRELFLQASHRNGRRQKVECPNIANDFR